MLEAVVRIRLIDDGRRPRTAGRERGHLLPTDPQRLFCALAPAGSQSVGEHDRIDGAGARSGDALEFEPAFLEQAIEHAPGEGAVAAAALQRQIDDFPPGGRSGSWSGSSVILLSGHGSNESWRR